MEDVGGAYERQGRVEEVRRFDVHPKVLGASRDTGSAKRRRNKWDCIETISMALVLMETGRMRLLFTPGLLQGSTAHACRAA